ncbi:MAG: DUF4231 domain-containing protein [Bacillota bacterium]|nr:DUF4231 domain-containing protein [Bacillota bacterium]
MGENKPDRDAYKEIKIMSENDYLVNRVDNKINYYDSKTKKHKWIYNVLKWLGLLSSAVIPLVVVLDLKDIKIITALLGVAGTIFGGTLSLTKSHELWIEYSKTTASLNREKYLYITRSGSYKKLNSFKSFVDTIESIISKENLTWADYMDDEIEIMKQKMVNERAINGTTQFAFMITAADQSNRNNFRIKIWDQVSSKVIYDNMQGAEETKDSDILLSGSFVIHKKSETVSNQ